MKQIQKWTLTMLDDVLATASHNPPAGPPPDFPVLITQLTDVIAQAKAAAVTQAVDRGSAVTALHAARTALFDEYLIPIRDIAVGRLTTVSNVNQLFRLPARQAHKATLIKEANIILGNATQYKDVFLASGLSATFLDQFAAAITAFGQADAGHTNSRGDRQKATQQLEATLTQGKQLVRGLNGIMQSAFAKSQDVLAAWNSARRIRRTHVALSSATPATATARTTPVTATPATTQPVAPAVHLVTAQPSTPQAIAA